MKLLLILKLDSLRDVWLKVLAPAICVFATSAGMGIYIFAFDGLNHRVEDREVVGRLLLFLNALSLAGLVMGLWLRALMRRPYMTR